MITPPEAGEPVDQLWRKVVELTNQVNALSNMTFEIRSLAIKGKLQVDGDRSVLEAAWDQA